MKRTVTVIVPVLNEAQNISRLYTELAAQFELLPTISFELLFVDDGSRDASLSIIEGISKKDARVHCIEFSRNFGKESATSAGIQLASGDALIMMDADLQHPPSFIPALIKEWEAGAEVVVGVRTRQQGERFIRRIGSMLFYAIMGMISETQMMPGETDFRLIDKTVAAAFSQLSERERMTRSLINWLGFRKTYVPFEAPARNGEGRYPTGKLLHLAIYTFVTNSLMPLKVAGYLGLAITLLSGLLGSAILVNNFLLGDPYGLRISGTAQLTVVNVFLVGIVLMALGVISLYIGTISKEAAGRPLFIIRKRINL